MNTETCRRDSTAASIEEIVGRFGHGSAEREVEARELVELVVWARQHGARRLVINGSFVTSKWQPNDVDVVLLPRSGGTGQEALSDLEPSAWPFSADPRCCGRGRPGALGGGRFRHRSRRPPQGRCGGDPMTERLSPQGYEQTKAKLANLEGRLAEIERRDDLSSGHREQVRRSYRQMMQQYRREIKLYEVLEEEAPFAEVAGYVSGIDAPKVLCWNKPLQPAS